MDHHFLINIDVWEFFTLSGMLSSGFKISKVVLPMIYGIGIGISSVLCREYRKYQQYQTILL